MDETKLCDDCGECDKCDLDSTKICDNCGKCIEYTDSYAKIKIDKIITDKDKYTRFSKLLCIFVKLIKSSPK